MASKQVDANRVVVCGGGLSGLTAAISALEAGVPVTLLTCAGDMGETSALAAGSFTIMPPLRANVSNNAAITVINTTGQQNIGFHRDCFSLASRPLETPAGLGVISSSIVDPVTGLALAEQGLGHMLQAEGGELPGGAAQGLDAVDDQPPRTPHHRCAHAYPISLAPRSAAAVTV